MKINNVLIIPNYLKEETLEYAKELVFYLKNRSVNAFILTESRCDDEGNRIKPDGFDFAVVLGGDGSVLLAERYLQDCNIPVVCINFGHVGYLTECNPSEGFQCMDDIIAGRFTIEERLMLRGVLHREGRAILNFHAVNDAVIHRSYLNHPLNVRLFINDKAITDITSDGIIISTPTGSTAYNLSAGGPVLTPTSRNFAITPISPRFGSCSPIVTSSDDIIKIQVEKAQAALKGSTVCVDGDDGFPINEGDILEISLSTRQFRLLKVKDNSFYHILQNKLSK